jgi:hypothetical protein
MNFKESISRLCNNFKEKPEVITKTINYILDEINWTINNEDAHILFGILSEYNSGTFDKFELAKSKVNLSENNRLVRN